MPGRSIPVAMASLGRSLTLLNVCTRCCRRYTTTMNSTTQPLLSAQEVAAARRYCLDLLRKYDTPSSLLLPYIPTHARDAYIALRAFNIDVARTADTTNTPAIGQMRLQFQRDAVTKALSGLPPKQPMAILLAVAAEQLHDRTEGRATFSKGWLMRIIDTREKYLSNRPYPDMTALESYAENTYSTLLYLTLQALPVASVTVDHVASHIGKASGIAAVLRGLPLLAFPGPANSHSNQGQWSGDVGSTKHGAVVLPLDVMAEHGVREEEVLRMGADAPGLRDAVFTVATRANDHLITARQMMQNIRAGQDIDHEFEHGHEEGHEHTPQSLTKSTQQKDLDSSHGVLMSAIPTQLWLDRLQQSDFNIFNHKLRTTDWKLPWRAFAASWRKRV